MQVDDDTILTLALDAGYTPSDDFGDDELLSFAHSLLNLPTAETACDAEQSIEQRPQPMTKAWCVDFPGAAAYLINELARQVDDRARMPRALRELLEIEEARIETGAFTPNAEAQRRIDAARKALEL